MNHRRPTYRPNVATESATLKSKQEKLTESHSQHEDIQKQILELMANESKQKNTLREISKNRDALLLEKKSILEKHTAAIKKLSEAKEKATMLTQALEKANQANTDNDTFMKLTEKKSKLQTDTVRIDSLSSDLSTQNEQMQKEIVSLDSKLEGLNSFIITLKADLENAFKMKSLAEEKLTQAEMQDESKQYYAQLPSSHTPLSRPTISSHSHTPTPPPLLNVFHFNPTSSTKPNAIATASATTDSTIDLQQELKNGNERIELLERMLKGFEDKSLQKKLTSEREFAKKMESERLYLEKQIADLLETNNQLSYSAQEKRTQIIEEIQRQRANIEAERRLIHMAKQNASQQPMPHSVPSNFSIFPAPQPMMYQPWLQQPLQYQPLPYQQWPQQPNDGYENPNNFAGGYQR